MQRSLPERISRETAHHPHRRTHQVEYTQNDARTSDQHRKFRSVAPFRPEGREDDEGTLRMNVEVARVCWLPESMRCDERRLRDPFPVK